MYKKMSVYIFKKLKKIKVKVDKSRKKLSNFTKS